MDKGKNVVEIRSKNSSDLGRGRQDDDIGIITGVIIILDFEIFPYFLNFSLFLFLLAFCFV